MSEQLALLSLNVNQFRSPDAKKHTLDHVKRFLKANDHGIAILHEVPYEEPKKNGSHPRDRNYTAFRHYWESKGYSILETPILEKGYRPSATFRTLAISNNPVYVMKDDFRVDRSGRMWALWVELEYRGYSILGVHIPEAKHDRDPREVRPIMFWDAVVMNSVNKVSNGKRVIVIGDMNANLKADASVPTDNTNRMKLLKQVHVKVEDGEQRGKYIGFYDAWEHCVDHETAWELPKQTGASGERLCGEEGKDTFVAGTRIDYALCSSDVVVEKMVVDDTVRSFTDHSAIKLIVS